MADQVLTERRGAASVITLNRPEARNAVDPPTAAALKAAFEAGEADPDIAVHVLTGAGGVFCAGADLKAVAGGGRYEREGPMGPTWLALRKPSIAAVEGPAVAGGLELAIFCDLRVASETAVFGVYCRRWGVPLIDGGTVRLPRLIGGSRAMDMILTGRPVAADEALAFGLANRVVPAGTALEAALDLAGSLAGFPQECLRNDRESALAQWSLPLLHALEEERRLGDRSLRAGAAEGAARFAAGKGRGGDFSDL